MRKAKQRQKRQTDIASYLSLVCVSLFLAISLCLCLLLVQYLKRPDVFPVRYLILHVKGDYSDIYRKRVQIAERMKGGFFSLRVSGLREYLLSQSEVKSVDVRRIFPNKLSVTVIERKPIAYWGSDAYISDQGVIFSPTEFNKNMSLPVFCSHKVNKVLMIKGYGIISGILSQQGLHLAKLTLTDRLSWRLELHNGAQIFLGQDNGFVHLRSFMRFYPTIVKRYGHLFKADLRYVDGFAVSRLPTSSKYNKQSLSANI